MSCPVLGNACSDCHACTYCECHDCYQCGAVDDCGCKP